MVRDHFRDLTIENILVIQDFQSKDLKREFYCSVKNERGFDTRRAQLEEEGEEAAHAVRMFHIKGSSCI